MIDTAYYFPAPYWIHSEHSWVKSLLLFFDEVAILLPRYMDGRHTAADPELAGPLVDRDLLRVLRPSEWIDEEMARELAEAMVEALSDGAFDELPPERHYHELSMSRIGYGADVELAEFLVAELRERGLARPSEDGVSVPLHPAVRSAILVLLAQMSRRAGAKRGMAVHPTSSARFGHHLVETLARDSEAARTEIYRSDLAQVGLNLEAVPLDDVLQFRKEHGEAYRMYRRDLVGFLEEWAALENSSERTALLGDRREEIADASRGLHRTTQRAFGKLPSWSFGVVGGAWSIAKLDMVGTLVSVIATLVGAVKERRAKRVLSVYSYLFEAQRELR